MFSNFRNIQYHSIQTINTRTSHSYFVMIIIEITLCKFMNSSMPLLYASLIRDKLIQLRSILVVDL